PGWQAHDRRRVRRLDEGPRRARGPWSGDPGDRSRRHRDRRRIDGARQGLRIAMGAHRRSRQPRQPNSARPGSPRSGVRHGLARVLSKAGLCSRTEATRWIQAGRVQVDGRVVLDPEYPMRDGLRGVLVDGQVPAGPERIYLALNKPRGLVTTARDEQGRDTVYRCLDGSGLPWLAPVGRLDRASEGLLLFSNDPAWAARVLDPDSGP